MPSSRVRAALFTAAVAIASLTLPGAAQAFVASSNITTPAVSPTYTFAEPSGKTTIAGNTDIIGEVDIRCYYGNEEESWSIVASKRGCERRRHILRGSAERVAAALRVRAPCR